MKNMTRILTGALFLAAGVASAEPVTLSAGELDNVSAGTYSFSGLALAGAGADAISNQLGITGSTTGVIVDPVLLHVVSANASSGSLAVSNYNPLNLFVNGAVATSGASASSSLF